MNKIHLGCLIDHSDCYRELRHIERERDTLRSELAHLRAQSFTLAAEVKHLKQLAEGTGVTEMFVDVDLMADDIGAEVVPTLGK